MVILGLSSLGDYKPSPEFLAAAGRQFEALLPEFGVQVPTCAWPEHSSADVAFNPVCWGLISGAVCLLHSRSTPALLAHTFQQCWP